MVDTQKPTIAQYALRESGIESTVQDGYYRPKSNVA